MPKKRIVVKDLPQGYKPSEAEMKHVSGGGLISFPDPIIGRTSFEDPLTALKSFEDPLTALTSFEDPLTARTSFSDPLIR